MSVLRSGRKIDSCAHVTMVTREFQERSQGIKCKISKHRTDFSHKERGHIVNRDQVWWQLQTSEDVWTRNEYSSYTCNPSKRNEILTSDKEELLGLNLMVCQHGLFVSNTYNRLDKSLKGCQLTTCRVPLCWDLTSTWHTCCELWNSIQCLANYPYHSTQMIKVSFMFSDL